MGREHRISRDARLCEEGHWRAQRVSAAVPGRASRHFIQPGAAIAGVDVGEDFLDFALIDTVAGTTRYARVAVASDAGDPIAHLAERIRRTLPEVGRGTIAMVDSPAVARASADGGERDLDTMLRLVVARMNEPRPRGEWINLALFPTPASDYFVRCAAAFDCKPHLVRIAHRLFGKTAMRPVAQPSRGGWIFTRFMLSGFAAHLALAQVGATVFESYPYLAFSAWKKPGEMLPPKGHRSAALIARRRIIARLAIEYGAAVPEPAGLDQADAAILALTAAISTRGEEGTLLLESDAYGRFLLPLPTHEMRIAATGLLPRA